MLSTIISQLMISCFLLFANSVDAAERARIHKPDYSISEDELNLYCLKLSYPQIKRIISTPQGHTLELESGQKIPYSIGQRSYKSQLDVSLKESMAQAYPLDPDRPITPPGHAPGRKRPYAFLEAIYGTDQKAVQRHLTSRKFLSSSLLLNTEAANAFDNALPKLKKLAASPSLLPYLKPEGAYYWRKIAGENVPSAHSWGIAIDLGVKKSPYWRWSKERPHPKQQSHPGELVSEMEKHGFIWGGKWHEYDLMHFEYRPELICKANMLKLVKHGKKAKFSPLSLKAGKKKAY